MKDGYLRDITCLRLSVTDLCSFRCRCVAELEGVEEVCLTTNGAALSQLAGPLRGAGVNRLNVSIKILEEAAG